MSSFFQLQKEARDVVDSNITHIIGVLDHLSDVSYSTAATALLAAASNEEVRILVTESDGTVVFDSSKGAENTNANRAAKTINENHNSRIADLTALLSSSGMGTEEKFSTSTGKRERYIAFRLGDTKEESRGVVRISKQL